MVEFRQPTWQQRAELRRILEKHGSLFDIAERKELPFDYCDKVLDYCYGMSDEQKNELSYGEMAELVTNAFLEIEIKPKRQKKK